MSPAVAAKPLALLLVGMLLASCEADRAATGAPAMPPLDVVKVAAETNEFQREMLADHDVTFAEYEKATLAAVECIKQAGYTVTGPYARENDARFLDFSFSSDGSSPSNGGPRMSMADVGEMCERRYRFDVARVWVFQNLLTPEQRKVLHPKVIACLRAAGATIAADATMAEVLQKVYESQDQPEVSKCRSQYPDYFMVGVQ